MPICNSNTTRLPRSSDKHSLLLLGVGVDTVNLDDRRRFGKIGSNDDLVN